MATTRTASTDARSDTFIRIPPLYLAAAWGLRPTLSSDISSSDADTTRYRTGRDELLLNGPDGGLRAGCQPEFGEDVGDVAVRCPSADDQLCRNLPIGVSPR